MVLAIAQTVINNGKEKHGEVEYHNLKVILKLTGNQNSEGI
jgi:hypothetical protein